MRRIVVFLYIFFAVVPIIFGQADLRTIKVTSNEQAQVDTVMGRLIRQGYKLDHTEVIKKDTVLDKSVVTNPFWHNIFFTASFGEHMFFGDFSNYGKAKQRLNCNWFVGAGKWFTPAWGFKVEGGMGQSSGFMDSQYDTPYTYGDLLTSKKGNTYYRERIKWFDIGINGIFNITRAIFGYEGPRSPRLKNQLIASVGIGYVGHYGYPKSYFVSDEFSARVELQYSRFIDKRKIFSVDAKLRGLMYQTNFDRHDHHTGSKKIDSNWGISAGMTIHLKHNVWGYKVSPEYRTNYLTQVRVDTIRSEVEVVPEFGQLTFYVFYPNNYSGRNDAPLIKDAEVNAVDYLICGTFTQKKYKDNGMVASKLAGNASPIGLEYVDVPTLKPERVSLDDGIPHGYEMCDQPLSLSMEKDALADYREKNGYYYAPIWDGSHAWHYRIDDATLGQRLQNADNYKESASFGLNGVNGLEHIRKNFPDLEKDEVLYSFADVYAAIEGNNDYLRKYTNAESVKTIKRIFTDAVIECISVTGTATNQDVNRDSQIGMDRNTALARNRAATILAWLKGTDNKKLRDAQSRTYWVKDLRGSVRKVNNAQSTRGIDAKVNRCVKVTVSYMIKNRKK